MPTLVNQLLTQLWSLTPAFFWLTKNVELIHSLALLGQQSSTRVSKWERFEELNKKVFLWELQGTYFDDYVPRSSQSGFSKQPIGSVKVKISESSRKPMLYLKLQRSYSLRRETDKIKVAELFSLEPPHRLLLCGYNDNPQGLRLHPHPHPGSNESGPSLSGFPAKQVFMLTHLLSAPHS